MMLALISFDVEISSQELTMSLLHYQEEIKTGSASSEGQAIDPSTKPKFLLAFKAIFMI